MELEDIKTVFKLFLKQCSNSIDRIELNEISENDTFVDTQTKEVIRGDGKRFYGVNFLFISESKKERDKIVKLLEKLPEGKPNDEFYEVGGEVNLYEGVGK